MRFIFQLCRVIWHHAVTIFLFTRSDIKTVVIPMSLSALSLVPRAHLSRIPEGIFWIWVHVLQFDISNQSIGIEEDRVNKAWRPLLAGRVTINSARLCWRLLVPTCSLNSLHYGFETACASLVLCIFTVIHNDFKAHRHWLLKNVVSAVGLAAFETGAAVIIGRGWVQLDRTSLLALCLSIAIHVTTLHAQDFKDVAGDQRIGRCTLPIIAPEFSRYTMICGLTAWSVALGCVWGLRHWLHVLLVILGIFTGYRFVSMREIGDDQVSYYWYNLWLAIVHLLPSYRRLMCEVYVN
ncbi:hypothetical protein K474DRAFT_1713083 [Panus rudis PR-1116 ss-1]|nr:hypothetical protein K474DRAFT_1713083 [Panus rudis PR-1116 ss-1]